MHLCYSAGAFLLECFIKFAVFNAVSSLNQKCYGNKIEIYLPTSPEDLYDYIMDESEGVSFIAGKFE